MAVKECIRKKGRGYHGRAALWCEVRDGAYVLTGSRGKGERFLSFEYVEWKARRLGEWCGVMGLGAALWHDGMKGTIAGYRCYIGLVDMVEWWCVLLGVKCEALLVSGLVGLEGCYVDVDIKGHSYAGVVERGGGAIETHFIRRSGKARPRFLKPYEIKSIKVIKRG